MVFLREQFLVLDKMTLAEIEALFAGDGPAKLGKLTPGEAHDSIPGAVFFEL